MKLLKITDTGIMKFATLDAVAGNTLAIMLEIEHSKMMRTIKRVIKNEKKRKSHNANVRTETERDTDTSGVIFNAVFKEFEYTDSMNRQRKTFVMNEDAAYLVIANTQSAKAHELKVWFKSEFNKMREERMSREVLRVMHPSYTDQVKALSEMLQSEGSRQHGNIYPTIQRQINKAVTKKPTPRGADNGEYRDKLSAEQLEDIKWFEEFVSSAVAFHTDKDFTGRYIRKFIKDGLHNYYKNTD